MVKYYIIIGIIYTIPYIVTIVISGLRKKLETDRNFYGKTIDIQKIELTNVSYKKFEIARNNIKKYTEQKVVKRHEKKKINPDPAAGSLCSDHVIGICDQYVYSAQSEPGDPAD